MSDLKKPIDWAGAGVSDAEPKISEDNPKDQTAYDPLPKADIAVITWTSAEWDAMKYVFTYKAYADYDYSKEVWQPYSRNFYTVYQDLWTHSLIGTATADPITPPSLTSMEWGYSCLITIGAKTVLLLKSSMHMSTDGVTIPLRQFLRQIIEESGAKLVLTIGTAGGTQEDGYLGDVNITNQATFELTGTLENAPFNKQTFKSDWKPNMDSKYMKAAQSLVSPVESLTVYVPGAGYPVETTIKPYTRDPKITDFTDKLPLLTTNGFVTGYINVPEDHDYDKNYLGDDYCVVEEDDAIVGMTVGEYDGVQFGCVRNLSDGAVNYDLQGELASTWPSTIYSSKGFDTAVNGAIVTWAAIAGMTR